MTAASVTTLHKPATVGNEAEKFSEHDRMRLSLAARIAGGICANPALYETPGWEGEAARAAMRVADRLLSLHFSGGC